MNIKMADAESNSEDSFVEDKIIDVLPGCSSSPAGKPSCPGNNQVYEFYKSFIHLDLDSVVRKFEQFFGKNEGHEPENDPTTIYNCLNKLYKRDYKTYNSRGKSRAEFLKKKITK